MKVQRIVCSECNSLLEISTPDIGISGVYLTDIKKY